MNRFLILILLLATACFMPGCGKGPQTSDVQAEKEIWRQQGWTYLETFGRPDDDAVEITFMTSDTADKITAFACTNNVQVSRDYVQTNRIYLVASMGQTNGDTFSLVFTKPKSPATAP